MKKLISLLLVLTLVIGLLPVAAFAEDSGSKDFWDGYELLYDGEPWKVYALEETTDTLTLDELNITLRDPSGSEVPRTRTGLSSVMKATGTKRTVVRWSIRSTVPTVCRMMI